MTDSIKSFIRQRKSVRTYREASLSAGDKTKIEEYLKSLNNPFGVPVEFRILEAKKEGLSSPVLVGAETYVGAKAPRVHNMEIAFGYEFERFVLYAQSLGIGTVWLAATIDRPAFEKAMEVNENEVMPAVTPIGYPAPKRSMREALMRKTLKADGRIPFDTLFFKGSFSEPLTPDAAGQFRDALEMVRLAPSAGNKQPWRAVVCGDTVHFYKKTAKGMKTPLGDIQKVDMGIALLHFSLTLEEDGVKGDFLEKDPELTPETDMEYIISYRMR